MNAFVYNNELYCGFGASDRTVSSVYTDIRKYDFSFSSWSYFTEIPNIEGFAGGYTFLINDVLYIGGEVNSMGMKLNIFYAFNFNTKKWNVLDNSPARISEGASFSIGKDFYVGGSGDLNFYKYDTTNESWSFLSPMKVITRD